MMKIIIIIAIITILLGIVLILSLKKEEKNNAGTVVPEIEYNDEIIEELSYQEYIIISNCLQRYIEILNIDNSSYYGYNENNEYGKVVSEKEIKTNIYNLMSKSYIENNNITIDNIYQYVNVVKENRIVIPTEIRIISQNKENANVKQYAVSVLSINTRNKEKFNYLYAILDIDYGNDTFSIEPVENKELLDATESKNKVQEVAKKSNNTFSWPKTTEQEITLNYFSNYKNILLSDVELAYSYLNEEYKQKRFNNIEKFKEYVQRNKKIFEKIRLEQYEVNNYEEYTEHIGLDQFGNIYFFNKKDVMNYNVILDAYTIELPEYTEKYDSCNPQEKVVLNIEKIKQALNSGDYTYVYNKLAPSFKNNKYKTEQEFENFIKSNLYDYMKIEYKNFKNEGETYIYDVTIKNMINEKDKEINMQIIMQLKEERDFIMSFSIK